MLSLFWATSLPLTLTALSLVAVEISVSFDNAVVNAKVLEGMSAFWRKAFLYVGIFIAVFGMRGYLPIQIVSLISGLGLGESFNLAMNDPDKFANILSESETIIAGLGGSFLILVGLNFFVDEDKDIHWVPWVEHIAQKLGGVSDFKIVFVAVVSFIFSKFVPNGAEFFMASLYGIALYFVVSALKHGMENISSTGGATFMAGLGAFIYLEVLDSTLSFDGVVAAFAMSNNIFVIMAGLGVGALFVRSMTIWLLETGTMAEIKYLEHGALYGLIFLGFYMYTKLLFHIPESVAAICTIGILVLAYFTSKVSGSREYVQNS